MLFHLPADESCRLTIVGTEQTAEPCASADAHDRAIWRTIDQLAAVVGALQVIVLFGLFGGRRTDCTPEWRQNRQDVAEVDIAAGVEVGGTRVAGAEPHPDVVAVLVGDGEVEVQITVKVTGHH